MARHKLCLRLLSWSLFIFFHSCNPEPGADHFRQADFNGDWYFQMGDIPVPSLPGQDPGEWIPVHLPHDWSILDYETQDSLHEGPFFKELPGGVDVGYLRDGIAWYRKEFESPQEMEGKQILLEFDGVQSQMELWVNGILIGEHVYGYTPFYFDIAPALKGPGENNVIAVKTINPGENSRWFTGAGIYRPVKLSVLRTVAVPPWGVYVTTPDVSTQYASITMEIMVSNMRETEVEVSGDIEIFSPGGKELKWKTEALTIKDSTAIKNKTFDLIYNELISDAKKQLKNT